MQVRLRPAGDIQRRFRDTAHTIDIAQRVRRGDRTEGIRVIYDGCKVINRVDECDIVRDAIDPCIIRGLRADKEVRVGGFRDVL